MDSFPFYLFYLDHFFGLGLEVGEQGRSQPDAVWQECPDPVLGGRNPAGSSVLPENLFLSYTTEVPAGRRPSRIGSGHSCHTAVREELG